MYLISDTHFYHDKIGIYCGRPNNWFDLIIKNWNNTVRRNDVVLHLGDFSFGDIHKVYDIRRRLNGKLYLIRGNHDRHSIAWYRRLDIKAISPFTVKINNKSYYFSHKAKKDISRKKSNIHGHWHDKCPLIYENEKGNINANLSVEVIGYTPIKFKHIMELVK
jgi:calcineurin-like phosphoesterase family protein